MRLADTRLGDLIAYLEDERSAVLVSIVILTIVGFLNRGLWAAFYSIAISYLVADLVLKVVVKSGENAVLIQSRALSRSSGHAYLAFLFFIVVITLMSGYFTSLLNRELSSINQQIIFLAVANSVIAALAYFDLHELVSRNY